MEIAFGIISAIALVVCIVIIVDKAIFKRKVRLIEIGNTGAEIKENTKLRFIIKKVIANGSYEAEVYSKLTIFKMRLIFSNGHLISKIGN